MGGHGGLNILPQKKWNVYNFDNREKVRKDEESAAKEEQLRRDLSRRHASSLRLQQLRRTNHPSPPPPAIPAAVPGVVVAEEEEKKDDGKHMNLFEGIRIFDPVKVDETKRKRREEEEGERRKKMMKTMRMKKEEVREVGPEDEKYRLGYGVAGKGVKAPWYALKRSNGFGVDAEEELQRRDEVVVKKSSVGKKSVEELREERLKRETAEKERERALFMSTSSRGRFSRDGERRQWR